MLETSYDFIFVGDLIKPSENYDFI
jgi:hypothetical protein